MKSIVAKLVISAVLIAIGAVATLILQRASDDTPVPISSATNEPAPQADMAEFDEYCEQSIGEARVEEVTPGVWLAIGFDLANTTVIATSEGNLVVDPSMSPKRAAAVKEAIAPHAPGKTLAIFYTHSHIDHIGGASAWMEEGTQVWATDRFTEHFSKQYGMFRRSESARGSRQFGRRLQNEAQSCSALGRLLDFDAVLETGIRLPTDTFSGRRELTFGDTKIELIEAHGETDDHLMLWLPEKKTMLPGDNFYRAFPNIYTIRGTRPRPVNDWIHSLDIVRAHDPEIVVPSHTTPLRGAEEVQRVLTAYRDGIQWVRDDVVRRANAGQGLDRIAAEVTLPPHLRGEPSLREFYGQVDWSARAIYTNAIGWFDGDALDLYPLPPQTAALNELALMGGAPAVMQAAEAALESGDAAWALHLLEKLRDSGKAFEVGAQELKATTAKALRARAADVVNSNGRSYLLSAALELEQGRDTIEPTALDDELIDRITLSTIFNVMSTRLKPEKSMGVYESVVFKFPDAGETHIMTVRHGIAEWAVGAPLPGTPEPVATLTADSFTYKKVALKQMTAPAALLTGKVSVDNKLAFVKFVERFDSSL